MHFFLFIIESLIDDKKNIYTYIYTRYMVIIQVIGWIKYGDWGWTRAPCRPGLCTSHNSLVTSTET